MAERRYIDLEDGPDLEAIVQEVHDTGHPVELRQNGHRLVLLTSLPEEPAEVTNEERRRRIMSFAGSMKGLIDEEVVEEVYRSRSVSSRSPDVDS